jgi:protease I
MDTRNARAVILTANLYQELEFWCPFLRLKEAGTRVTVAAATAGEVYGSKLGVPVIADVAVAGIEPSDFDLLVIPGGFAPEALRLNADVIDLVRKTDEQGKLIAAICHAPWVLVSAGIAEGRRLTCVRGIRDDVRNGGAVLLDEPVVRDGNLITSRLPNDIDAFCGQIIRTAGASSQNRRPAPPTPRRSTSARRPPGRDRRTTGSTRPMPKPPLQPRGPGEAMHTELSL